MPGFDLAIFSGQQPRGDVLVNQALAPREAPTGLVVAGVAKLAQRVLLRLLTSRGGMLYRPDDGSSLPQGLQTGRIRTPADARAAFAFDAARIERQAAAEVRPDDSPDEILASLTLQTVTLAPPQVILTIRLVTQAGGGFTLTLPVERRS